MTGKTHKFIGVAAGIAAAYQSAYISENPAGLLYVLACPIGAMIADIDHNGSKIGRQRKFIVRVIIAIFVAIVIMAATLFIADAYKENQIFPALLTIGIILVPFVLLALLTKIKAVKKNLKFITKHRGLMHTLILPACMFGALNLVKEPNFSIVLAGLNIGYITHIVADLLTVRGCPILYPLTKRNIKLMNIKTGTTAEYIAGTGLAIIIGAIIIFDLIKIP